MNTVADILKNNALRVTNTREMVMDLFLHSKTALSNQDIETALEDIDRITLYRTLRTFEEKGIIHKAIDGTNVAKYAFCAEDCDEHQHYDHHAHFHCSDCGQTYCVEEIEVPYLKSPDGFKIKSANVILSGSCDKCS